MNLQFMYKYQPLYLKDCEMDENMRTIHKILLSMDSLNILLVGDSGCGKTSLIHALIREYYNPTNIGQHSPNIGQNIAKVPSNEIQTHQQEKLPKVPSNEIQTHAHLNENILFINSLKEQGIAYYRNDVKTFCQTTTTIPGKKKIIVLDDIDNINDQSQQVFRNCIDKYSHNVHFIASCSNMQKVIDSMQSRMTILKVKPLTQDHLKNILKKICVNENIKMEKSAENFILSICNHSARILINYLEKCKLLDMDLITEEMVSLVCTNISFKDFTTYTELCKIKKSRVEATYLLFQLFDKGYSVMDILDNYFVYVKISDILTEDEKYRIIPLLCKYITVFHNIHEDEIELALFTNNLVNIFI
jgi:DNA polymerase III delta prime subunit